MVPINFTGTGWESGNRIVPLSVSAPRTDLVGAVSDEGEELAMVSYGSEGWGSTRSQVQVLPAPPVYLRFPVRRPQVVRSAATPAATRPFARRNTLHPDGPAGIDDRR
jgi:hypothetical protein